MCRVDLVLVASSCHVVELGAGERRLHAHPFDSPPERRAHLHGFEIWGFESAPDWSAAQSPPWCGSAGHGVSDRFLCEMGDGCRARRCPAIARYVRPCHLVDRQRSTLFWRDLVSAVFVSSLLSILDRPHPRVCFEMDRRILATTVCDSGANHVSGSWGSGDAGWNHAVNPGTGYRSCTRVQQYSVQSNAGRHHHGFGASIPALMVAESSARCSNDSVVCGQERTADRHHWRTRHSRGPWVSQRETPSPWRRNLLWYRGNSGDSVAMDPAAHRVSNAVEAVVITDSGDQAGKK